MIRQCVSNRNYELIPNFRQWSYRGHNKSYLVMQVLIRGLQLHSLVLGVGASHKDTCGLASEEFESLIREH